MKIINSLICKVILLVAIQQICFISAFSQSKKDQIETLILQKDSLSQTLSKEREMTEKYKNEQEQKINLLNNRLKDIELKLLQANQAINEKNKEVMGLQNEILILSDSLSFLKSELNASKKLDFLALEGYWCNSEYSKDTGEYFSLAFENYENVKSIRFNSGGPFTEYHRIEFVEQNKFFLFFESIEGSISFNSVNQSSSLNCKSIKVLEGELINDLQLKLKIFENPCSYMPNNTTILLKRLSNEEFCQLEY